MPRTISIVSRLLVMMLLLSHAPQCPSLAVARGHAMQDPSLNGAKAAAAKAFKEAQELRAQGSPEALRKAIEKYEEAALLLKSIGDRPNEAAVLFTVAIAYSAIGQHQKAIDSYNQSLPIFRALGDRSAEAKTLINMGKIYADLGEKQEALDYLNQALLLKRALGDNKGEADTLMGIGSVYSDLDEKRRALEFYNQALPLWRASGDRRGEAITLNNIGKVYAELRENQKALEFFNQALPLERVIGDGRGEALTLNNIAHVYEDLNEKQKAIDYYNQSLPLFRANRDHKKEAETLDLIGSVYSQLGEILKAVNYYGQAFRIQRAIGDRAGEAASLNNAAGLYNQFGMNQEALNLLKKALLIMRAIGDRSGEATTLVTTGTVYGELGEKQKALDYYNQALAIVRASGDRRLEAYTLHSIAWVSDALGEKQKALDYLNQALTILKVVPDRSLEARVLNGIAEMYRAQGEKQKALELHNQALLITRAIGERRSEAHMLSSIGAIHISLGQMQKAHEYYNQALPIQIISGDRGGEATTLSHLMELWGTRNVPLAVFYGKQAVNIYQKLRANITSQDKEVQKNFLRTKEKTYRRLAHLLISLGRLPEAQQVLNFFKDQQFFDFNQNMEKPASSLTPTPREALIADKYGRAFNEDQVKIALKEAEAEFAQPRAEKDKVGEIADTRELQTALGELGRQTGQKAVAVYTLIGDSNFRALLVTADSITAASQQIPGDALNQKALQLWGLLQSDKYDPTSLGQELYSVVFKPIEAQLPKDTNTILWSLDGSLRYVPMAALHDGKQYLIERYNHVAFTRADSERLLRAVSPRWTGLGLGSSQAHTVELLGDRISFNALPGVTEELRALFRQRGSASGVLDGEVLPDARFTKAAMLAALKQKRPVVHISSHFSFRPGDEARSFLLLGDGTAMTLEEMKQQLDLFAGVELLTLSACNTAAQQAGANGREIDGFAELAQRLGAGSVMATLWPVADNSTPWLMREFYQTRQGGQGLSKAEAFRRAQLALLNGTAQTKPLPAGEKGPSSSVQIVIGGNGGKRDGVGTRSNVVYVAEKDAPPFKRDEKRPFAHPYYWAPFILIGNWR